MYLLKQYTVVTLKEDPCVVFLSMVPLHRMCGGDKLVDPANLKAFPRLALEYQKFVQCVLRKQLVGSLVLLPTVHLHGQLKTNKKTRLGAEETRQNK